MPEPKFEKEKSASTDIIEQINKKAGEKLFSDMMGQEMVEDREKEIDRIFSILKIPKEEWVEHRTGQRGTFNNFICRLPGDERFESGICDDDIRTYAERGLYNEGMKKANLTPKEFFTLILHALIENGLDPEQIARKNQQINEIANKVSDIRGKSQEAKEQRERLTKEYFKLIAELEYDVAPALVRLIKLGFNKGEFTG